MWIRSPSDRPPASGEVSQRACSCTSRRRGAVVGAVRSDWRPCARAPSRTPRGRPQVSKPAASVDRWAGIFGAGPEHGCCVVTKRIGPLTAVQSGTSSSKYQPSSLVPWPRRPQFGHLTVAIADSDFMSAPGR